MAKTKVLWRIIESSARLRACGGEGERCLDIGFRIAGDRIAHHVTVPFPTTAEDLVAAIDARVKQTVPEQKTLEEAIDTLRGDIPDLRGETEVDDAIRVGSA